MTFALTPANAPVVQGLPGNWLQVKKDGAIVGDANVQVIDIVADPGLISATRGVGEKSHIITISRPGQPNADAGAARDTSFLNVVWLYLLGANYNDSALVPHNAVAGAPTPGQFTSGSPFPTLQPNALKQVGGTPINSATVTPGAPITLADLNGAYTIELWFRITSIYQADLLTCSGVGNPPVLQADGNGAGKILLNSPAAWTSAAGYADSNWHFFSISRDAGAAGKTWIAVDGVLQTPTGLAGAGNTQMTINGTPGMTFLGTSTLNQQAGFGVCNVRGTHGVNRYTIFPYAVPTAPFPTS